jgi:hypothetical protein
LFQVIDQSFEPLIGLQSSLDLNVVTINNVDSILQSASLETHKSHDTYTVISKAHIGQCYKDIFGTDLGKLPVEYHRMKLDPEVKPVIRPPRRKSLCQCKIKSKRSWKEWSK